MMTICTGYVQCVCSYHTTLKQSVTNTLWQRKTIVSKMNLFNFIWFVKLQYTPVATDDIHYRLARNNKINSSQPSI